VSSTIIRFEDSLAPCGKRKGGERQVTEDQQGLIAEQTTYGCGCRSSKEEFHDGSVHMMVVHHKGKVLIDQELRGG
jgi:hypothetical protein